MSELLSIRQFGFGSPIYLLALLVVPLVLIVSLLLERGRSRYAVSFTNLEVLASVVEKRHSLKVWLPLALLLLALATAAAAVAKPKARVTVSENHATVVLLVDISASMSATDIEPSRISAANDGLNTFVDALPSRFKVGLVSFSTHPTAVTRPTNNRQLLENGFNYLAPSGATAVGDGLRAAVRMADRSLQRAGVHHRAGDASPALIVLESDGAQNRGTLSSLQGAQLARRAGISVDTVVLGTPHGFIIVGDGPQTQKFSVPPDPGGMAQIAKVTGGHSFDAQTAGQLDSVYQSLGSTIGRRREIHQITSWFAVLSAALLVGAVGLARAWGSLLP